MIKVFVVDDEKWVRQSIKHAIDWEKHGYQIIGEEDDGLDAFIKIVEMRPQIVIADIRMPGLDGIKLLEKVKQQLPDILFIFISGYNQFRYAQEALNLGAINYILKPIDGSKLMQALNQAEQKIKKNEQVMEHEYIARRLLNMEQNQFVISLLEGNKISESVVKEELQKMGLQQSGFIVWQIMIDNYLAMKRQLLWRDIELLSFAVQNITAEMIQQHSSKAILAHRPDGGLAVILNLHEDVDPERDMRIMANDIVLAIKKYQYVTVTIGVGKAVPTTAMLPESAAEAARCLDFRVQLGTDRVILPADCAEGKEQFDLLSVEEETELIKMLSSQHRTAFFERIDKLFVSLQQREGLYPYKLIFLFRYIAELIFMMAAREGRSIGLLQDERRHLLERLEGSESIDEWRELIKKTAEKMLLTEDASEKDEKRSAVRQMQEYVYAHYDEKVDLQVLAKHIYMHPVYLSKVFKQETGTNFTDFLLDYRMRLAEQYMKQEQYELSDIARLIGFEDYSYFNKQFRKVFGIPPQEYRRRLIKTE